MTKRSKFALILALLHPNSVFVGLWRVGRKSGSVWGLAEAEPKNVLEAGFLGVLDVVAVDRNFCATMLQCVA